MQHIFSWLASPGSVDRLVPYGRLVGLLLLIAGLAWLLSSDRSSMNVWVWAASALLGFGASAVFNTLQYQERPLTGNIACIDTSHLERVDYTYAKDESFLGLSYNLMRAGFLPVEMNTFSAKQLEAGTMLVAVAPTKAFSSSELEAIKRFMDHGGTFLLCTGWDEVDGARELLDSVGLGIKNVPLGPVDPQSNTAGIRFSNAWPVRIKDPNTTHVICSTRDSPYPLIVQRAHGSGRLILISDPAFLNNSNLESFQAYVPENVGFFNQLLTNPSLLGPLTLQTEGK